MGCCCFHRLYYNDSSTPSVYHLNWMENIPDNTKLTEMTIPGTHDSCARYGICCARTQSWTIPEQLKAGLRYFDLRLRSINNTLRAYHGFVDQKDTFDMILQYALNFLDQNPSEAIIFELIDEYQKKNCTKKMDEMYEEYIANYKNRIIEYQYKNITMGEMRGKVMIVKVFYGSTSNINTFYIQNKWTVNCRCLINTKKRHIKKHFRRVLYSNDKDKVFLNYLSCSSDYAMMTPYTATKKCNELPLRYNGRLGVVLADYPGEDLIEHLINQNFQVVQKEIIKEGNEVYMVHNDTQKYLYVEDIKDKNDINIYCRKEPKPYIISHKDKNIGRDTFKVGDDIKLFSGQNSYDFKIAGGLDEKNDKDIDEGTLIILQVLKNEEFQSLQTEYESKNNKNEYEIKLLNEIVYDYPFYYVIQIKK